MNSKSLEERKYRWDRSEQNSQKVQCERKRTDFSPFKREFSNVRKSHLESDTKLRNSNTDLLIKDVDSSLPLLQIQRSSLDSNKEMDCSCLKNFKVVGSYNWAFNSTPNKPVLVIPGTQVHLSNDVIKLEQLKKQISVHYEDKNAVQFPEFPIEPIYLATIQCTPDYDFSSVDFICDRKIFRSLLNYIEKKEKEYGNFIKDGFRLDFQRIGNSIVILKYTEGSKKFSHDFSQDFENNIINKGKMTNSLHYKVASYELGNLKILLRFDANYCKSKRNHLTDDLSSLMSDIDLNNNNGFSCKIEDSKLSCVKRGTLQDCQETVEIATRSTYKDVFDFPRWKWEALFFTKIEFLLIGWHSRGMLKKVEKLSFDEVTSRCNRTKKTIHESMSKLTDLLGKLKDFAFSQQEENVRYSAVFIGGNDDCINVYKCDDKKDIIPSRLAARIYDENKTKREPIYEDKASRYYTIKLANEIYG